MMPATRIAIITRVVITGRRMNTLIALPRPGLISTTAPGTSRSCPSVTTFSPAAIPPLITVKPSMVPPVVTSRFSTFLSAPMT